MTEAPLLVAVSGSPRDGSISRDLLMTAVDAASEEGLDTVLLDVRRLRIAPCEGCEACARGPCVIDDDMGDVIELLGRADAAIVASPIYFSGPTSQLKALIDRCQPVWHDRADRREAPGGIIPEPMNLFGALVCLRHKIFGRLVNPRDVMQLRMRLWLE